MFTLEEVLSKRNQAEALEYLQQKKDSCGVDGMYLSELKEYWELNKERILEELGEGTYSPGIIKNHEIINGRGKRRIISKLNTIDRFITRLLSQKFSRYVEPTFLRNSHAYQTFLDIRIDVIHSANRRSCSLNLECPCCISRDFY